MSEGGRTLDLDENLGFQRREWRVQRVAWLILTLFVIAAGLGLFGRGPISHAEWGNTTAPLWVRYERFVHVGASNRMTVQCQRLERSVDNEALLRMSRAYFDSIRIDRIAPEPLSIDIGPLESVFRFAAPLNADVPVTFVFEVTAVRAGFHSAELRSGAAAATVAQLAYF
jgi:hypothetical protein